MNGIIAKVLEEHNTQRKRKTQVGNSEMLHSYLDHTKNLSSSNVKHADRPATTDTIGKGIRYQPVFPYWHSLWALLSRR